MQNNRMARFVIVLLFSFVAHNSLGGCARGDRVSGTAGPSGALGGAGLGGSGSDMHGSAGVDNGDTGAIGTGSSGDPAGAATGTIDGTSGTSTSGTATIGAPTTGDPSDSAASGSPASGSATAGTASTGTGSTGTSGAAVSGIGASGASASGTASSGSAASGTASSGNAGLTLVARLNLNGPDHMGVDYPGLWKASPTACGPFAYQTSHALHGTNDAPLFQGEINGNPVTCKVGTALAAGTYRVRLYFAEIYFGPGCVGPGGVGTRVFDILLEGTPVLRNLDVFAESGGCMASTTNNNGVPVVKQFDVMVTDGVLDISLAPTRDRAKISALEVFGPL
jgi:Malectin domain